MARTRTVAKAAAETVKPTAKGVSKTKSKTKIAPTTTKKPPPSKKATTSKPKPDTKAGQTPAKNPPNIGRPRKRKNEEVEPSAKAKARKVEKHSTATGATRPAPRKARSKAVPASTKTPTAINERPKQTLKVYVFGSNQQGELGLGEGASAQDVKRPRLNPNLDPAKVGVVQVSAGGMHTAALTKDNTILTWGVNDLGALGRDTEWSGGLRDIGSEDSDEDEGTLNPKEATPMSVDFKGLKTVPVFVQVAAGDNATFALTEDGEVYGWGTFKVRKRSRFDHIEC